jgi:hypothetical protein
MVAKVIFYRTTRTGQDVAGVVTMADGRVMVESGPPQMLDTLFQGLSGDADSEALLAAMRDAPRRFDGSYLRAEYQEVQGGRNA